VDKWLKDEKFYVWRNEQVKAVSLVIYTTESHLFHVFTPKEEICKGYYTTLV
jgi:hypothetical protein